MAKSKRMPNTSRIKRLAPPADIAAWYERQAFSPERATAYFVRDYLIFGPENSDLFLDYFKKQKDQKSIRDYHEKNALIAKEGDPEKLLALLDSPDYAKVRFDIIDRILELAPDNYRLFIQGLEKPFSDSYLDHALRGLSRKLKVQDITDEIIALLEGNHVRDPGSFSSILQVLGFQKKEKNLAYLYSYYTFFKDNFPGENFFEGPLYGIGYYLGESRNG